eukprot:Selendium_serpulae@DN6844_c0_g1_i1.p1
MRINIANPATGLQTQIDFEDETKVMHFFGKRIGNRVDGANLGLQFAGYRFKITGGYDKDGVPMMPGVVSQKRVYLLLRKGMKCYRPMRKGHMRRRLVRGCIVSNDLSVLALSVEKKGEGDIPGLTDGSKPSRLGPKRAGRIRKKFSVAPGKDLRGWVVRRTFEKDGKTKTKAPKIQRLVTTQRLLRKQWMKRDRLAALNATKAARKEFDEMMKKIKDQKLNKDKKPKVATKATK